MKLIEKQNYFGPYFVLEGIKQSDIRFANLGGRYTGGQYDDPDKPKHEYIVWIDDEEVLEFFKGLPITIGEKLIESTNETRYSVKFKAYPKKRINRRNMKEETTPFVLMRTSDGDQRLNAAAFGLIDSAHIDTVDISFHLWEYAPPRPDSVCVIDELICNVDEVAGEVDKSYLREKYAYRDEYDADDIADAEEAKEEAEEIESMPFH